jgi:hypothetical protein
MFSYCKDGKIITGRQSVFNSVAKTDKQTLNKLPVYGSTVLSWTSACFFGFFIVYTVGRTPWPVARPLPNQRQNKLRHSYLEWDSNPRSQCSSERRQFMPYTVRPLKLALNKLKENKFLSRNEVLILFFHNSFNKLKSQCHSYMCLL